MNQENFEQAYVESNARIALVLAESLGLISETNYKRYRQETDQALAAHNEAERKRLGVKPYPSQEKLQAMAKEKLQAMPKDKKKKKTT